MSSTDTEQQALRKEMRETAQAMEAMLKRRLAEQAATGPSRGLAGRRRVQQQG